MMINMYMTFMSCYIYVICVLSIYLCVFRCNDDMLLEVYKTLRFYVFLRDYAQGHVLNHIMT